MRKRSAILGTILVSCGFVLSTIAWIITLDAGSHREYPFGDPQYNPLTFLIAILNIIVSMPAFLIGIPFVFYGVFERFSSKMAQITGYGLILPYIAFWIIVGITY